MKPEACLEAALRIQPLIPEMEIISRSSALPWGLVPMYLPVSKQVAFSAGRAFVRSSRRVGAKFFSCVQVGLVTVPAVGYRVKPSSISPTQARANCSEDPSLWCGGERDLLPQQRFCCLQQQSLLRLFHRTCTTRTSFPRICRGPRLGHSNGQGRHQFRENRRGTHTTYGHYQHTRCQRER